ncbi:MAG: hypothetical protein ACLP7P_09655 [Rhodomicrobium sp.]
MQSFPPQRLRLRSRNSQLGIALGPILFIIAIIAILAGVIAAGSGGFNANTATESAKAMAEVVVNSCGAYQDALNLMLHNGCDVTALDYTPSGGGWPAGSTWNTADYTSGNGTNQAGNGQCALFDPRGGGMIFKKLPAAALAATTTGAYTSADPTGNVDAFAGYPFFMGHTCINNTGTCGTSTANATLSFYLDYISYPVCQQINKILSITWDPNTDYLVIATSYYWGLFNNQALISNNSNVQAATFMNHPTVSQGCARDLSSTSGTAAYAFMCPVMIR